MVEFNPKITKAVLHQNHVREEWGEHDSAERLEEMFWAENTEYIQARDECMLGADPFILASEAGDTGYLYIRRMEFGEPSESVKQRMEEIATECEEVGLNINEAIVYKLWRNDLKYQNIVMNLGIGYDQAVKVSKNLYKEMGGEEAFNPAYMLLADDLFSF